MATLAIIGPGAIGGTVAAWLAQDSRHQVIVAARSAFADLEVQTPSETLRAKPQILTSPDQAMPVDWVLVTTKAYDAAAASQWFSGFVGATTRVAVLQNGVEHIERFAPYVERARILPVMVDCPAERSEPGRIRQRGPARMVVPGSEAGSDFAALFANTRIDVAQDADFTTQLWGKLCLNSAGAFSAMLLKPAIIARHDGVADLMRAVIRECIAVSRAEGAQLHDSLADSIVEGYRKAPPDSVNSLHADRLAGRPMEIDARNGAIVRIGRRHGIETPLNCMIVALLESTSL
ncbi:MAG TPA: 2-dehydropantoate 2-reductase [Povalibacter sp.]